MDKNKVMISLSEYERLKAIEKEFESSDINSLKKEIEQIRWRLKVYSENNKIYQGQIECLITTTNDLRNLLNQKKEELTQTNDMLQHEQEINSKIKSRLKSNILLRFLFRCDVSDYKKGDENSNVQKLEIF